MRKEKNDIHLKFIQVIFLDFLIGTPIIGITVILTSTSPGCPVGSSSWHDLPYILVAMVSIIIFAFLLKKSRKSIKQPRTKIKTIFLASIIIIMILLGLGVQIYGVVVGIENVSEILKREKFLSQNTARIIYQSTEYNAFPKVYRLQNGTLWAVWYKGDGHVDSNNNGRLVQAFSNDNGLSWSEPVTILDDPYLDTRNPALGQLENGTLIVQAFQYNGMGVEGLVSRCDWIQSDDGGISWSQAREITAAEFNPAGVNAVSLISPFGNLFEINSHELTAVYGGGKIILIEFNYTINRWQYFSTPFNNSAFQEKYGEFIEFYESDVEIIGNTWLAVARSSKNVLYYAFSEDGKNWSDPIRTGYKLGHSPDILLLNSTTSDDSCKLFFVNRGEHGLLRGGLATFNLTSHEFTCEDKVLYAALGRGGGDFGYASSVRLNASTVGFINYDVVICESLTGNKNVNGKILWQLWEIP
ncbi:MAG: sialidase family protein [Promethearchaeota archaeon]